MAFNYVETGASLLQIEGFQQQRVKGLAGEAAIAGAAAAFLREFTEVSGVPAIPEGLLK